MKRRILALLVLGSVILGSTAMAGTNNVRYCVDATRSGSDTFSCSTDFGPARSCGKKCSYWVIDDTPSLGIWGAYVLTQVRKTNPLIKRSDSDNWYYWDSDYSSWRTQCDYEGPAGQDTSYNYHWGYEAGALDNDNTCVQSGNATMKYTYRYTATPRTRWTRKYYGACVI